MHLREYRCAQCNDILAEAGARSFIVNPDGFPVDFDESTPPAAMTVRMVCRNGHQSLLAVPGDVSAESTMMTPDDAPIATDATLVHAD